MTKDYYNIDERIAQLEAQNIQEKQELIYIFKSTLNQFQPFNIVGDTLWKVLKIPSVRKVLIGLGMQLFTKLFVKK
jgi:hypothetical protein